MVRANLAIVIPFGLITEVIMGEQAVKGAKHRKRLALDSYARSMMELAKPKGISGVEREKHRKITTKNHGKICSTNP
jgi:hypothetical protein